jgi:Protein of unknown function (DUF3025)
VVELAPAARRLLEPDSMDAPWFDSVRDAAARLPSLARASWPTVAEIDRALAPAAGVRFVPGTKSRARRDPRRPIDREQVYEIQIASRREVPTREHSAHDLLNALAWAAFPAAKWALSAQLAEQQAARLAARPWRLPGARTRRHDRLALLDEGGILVARGSSVPGESAAEALAGGRARALVFGHALLEHALAGALDVWGTALSFAVPAEGPIDELRRGLDRALADALDDGAILDQAGSWPRLELTALGR